MTWRLRSCLAAAVLLMLGGCTPAQPDQPASLTRQWMIGIAPMTNDPVLMHPSANRFLATLAAMPKTSVVWLGSDVNVQQFNVWPGDKLLVRPTLHAGADCMQFTYAVERGGQQRGLYGLVVPALPAGPEPDPACIDRAASDFYRQLVRQGL